MTRVLRIELRRSAAAGIALVLLLAGAILLYATTDAWAAGWMPLAMAQRQYLVLLWPLALAGGAWQARREQRSRVAELFASTARPRAQRVAPILTALAIAVLSGYLAMAAVAVPRIIDTASYLPTASFAVLAVGALSLIAAAWLGMAVGHLVPSPLTAPALAVAGIALLLLLTPATLGGREWLVAIFSPMRGMGLYNDFRTVSGGVSAAQGIWLAALAVTGVVLLAAGSRRARAAALLPAVIGAAVAILVIPRGADVESPIDSVARELVCTEESPRVCISRMHSELLPEVTPLARQGLAMLAKLPDAPTTAMENTNTFLDEHPRPQRPDTALFNVKFDRDGGLADKDDFLPRMLDAAGASADHCPERMSRPVSRAAASWLMEREPPDVPSELAEVNAQTRTLWQGLRELPEREAAARVAAVRAAALACQDLDGLLTRSAT
jgi:hypothetical protein